MISLVLADDHALFRQALQPVLEQQGFRVRGSAASVPALLLQLRSHQPNVCLLDHHFPGQDGVEAIPVLRKVAPRTAILVLGADHAPRRAQRALEYGASGYLHHTRGLTSLITAIHRVHAGERFVEVPAQRPATESADTANARLLAGQLTARERECLAMLVAGCGTSVIATKLGVSPTTVRTHIQSVLTKLGVHSRLEAASFAVRHGLVDHSTGLATAL